tara:strand:- start:114 stop:1367 length:1254 start_codon:yes stop_codon:yes gene_type:complete
MDDLPLIVDIIDSIIVDPKDEENRITDIKECLYVLIGDILNDNVELYKHYNFKERVINITHDYFKDLYDFMSVDIDLYVVIEEVLDIYFMTNNNPRSYPDTFIMKKNDKIKNKKILDSHRNKSQPDQRTPAWFNFRHSMLTASDFYKIFDTQASQNNLILKKCSPIDVSKYTRVNTDSACHHGHLFEPISLLIYMKLNNTTVGEFGCISHSKYNFIGASPDGINVDENNELFCRLVEVKNPVSRIITGTPKKEYWVQMQIQMEVWNFDECDFLETTFHQYETEEEYKEDGDYKTSADGKQKGMIVQFFDGKEPFYEYMPLDLNEAECAKWYDSCFDKNTDKNWIKNIYWKVKVYSCVLVTRNKQWFESKIQQITDFWELIKKERIDGFEHRRPKSRKKNNVVIKIDTELLATIEAYS